MYLNAPLRMLLNWPRQMAQDRRRARRLSEDCRRAEEFLKECAPEGVRPSSIALLSARRNRIILRGETPSGPAAIKIYLPRRIAIAQRCLKIQKLLEDKGIPIPPLLFSAADEAAVRQYGMAILMWEFVEASRNPPGLEWVGPEAMRLLGRLNSIRGEEAAPILTDGESGEIWNRPDEEWLVDKARYIVDLANRHVGSVPDSDAQAILETFARAAREIAAADWPESLLFMDFNKSNAIPGAGGGLTLLDIEMCSIGAPCWDMGYGAACFTRTRISPLPPAEELFESAFYRRLIESYLETAPEFARAQWERHGRAAAMWGYLCVTRAIINRAVRANGRPRSERTMLLRWARNAWGSLEEFARKG